MLYCKIDKQKRMQAQTRDKERERAREKEMQEIKRVECLKYDKETKSLSETPNCRVFLEPCVSLS